MFKLGLYQDVMRRSIADLFEGESGLEIFSQIVAERKFGGYGAVSGLRLILAKAICYKNCATQYSAVAQWQSIRLLTEGL